MRAQRVKTGFHCIGIVLAAFVVCLAAQASAQVTQLYVAPNGSDANDCLSAAAPCATLQNATNLVPGRKGRVAIADGVYHQTVNVTHHKTVTFTGNCTNIGAVVIDGGGVNGQIIFWAQDNAVVIAECLTCGPGINAGTGQPATGSTCMRTRQFAVGDANSIRFDAFPGGVHLSATESSKINAANPYVIGGAHMFAQAVHLSQITLGTVTVSDGLAFYAFLSSMFGSIIQATVPINGGVGQTGYKYSVDNATLLLGTNTIPGTGAMCNDPCVVR